MLPLVTAQTVAFDRGFGGRIWRGRTYGQQLKPLDVERETRPGKYPDGDGLYLVVASATSKNWSYRYWQDSKQRWLGLALQLPFPKISESMGNHDSKIVDAGSVD